jgi:hypothetical protein
MATAFDAHAFAGGEIDLYKENRRARDSRY